MKASAGNRVLMLLENNPYPQDPRVRRECKALLAAGYRVSVICPADPGQRRQETVNGVFVYRYPASSAGDGVWGYLWEYTYSLAAMVLLTLRLWVKEGFDIIHAANPPDTLFTVAVFYKLFGKRFVYDHHDLSPELYDARFRVGGNRLVYRVLVALEKLSCRVADLVVATNESYKQIEMERGRVAEDHIVIVRSGPELAHFHPVEPDPELRRKAPTIIAYAGMMGYQDGLDYLLRSLRHLAYDLGRRDFFCVLIGGRGDARAYLAELTTNLGLDELVWFTGWVSDDDYVRYLSSADICVDPDPANPFNNRSSMNKMVEYMALGKPIVAFDLPEHHYTAQAAAAYVPANDETEFARAIAALIDDRSRRQEMGAFGRKRFEAQLSWECSATYLIRAYSALLPQHE